MKQLICGNAVKFERNEDCPRKKTQIYLASLLRQISNPK